MTTDDVIHDDEVELISGTGERGGLMERILSPEALQKMMGCGGGLLVVGFVVWLWSIGLFANPVIVAVIIGGATLGMIAVGTLLYTQTRYRLAGTGLTLLGSLALPLNLWFYDAQGLITLANGGHLWMPAALCCVIYTAVAWTMRNRYFVYAIVGGVVMTGMLFLADTTVDQFWFLMPHVTFLTSVGWVCRVAGRQFPEGDGEFSHEKFGRSFRIAGALVLGGGLALLAGGQVLAMLSSSFAAVPVPLIATVRSQQAWALGILLATTAGLVVESVLCRSRGASGLAAVLTGTWSVLTLVDVLGIRPTLGHLVTGISMLITIVNVISLRRNTVTDDSGTSVSRKLQDLRAATEPFAFLLAASAAVQFIGQWFVPSGNLLISPTGWMLVVQLAASAAAIWSTAVVAGFDHHQPARGRRLRGTLAWLGAGSATLSLWTAGVVMGWSGIVPFTVVSFVLPVMTAVAACVVPREGARSMSRCIAWGAQTTSLTLLGIASVLGAFVVPASPLVTCVVMATAATVWYLTAASQRKATGSICGHVSAGIAISQLLVMAGVNAGYALALVPTMIGMALRIVLQFAGARGDDAGPVPRVQVAPNLLVLFGNAAGILLAGTRLLADEQSMGLIGMLSLQLAGTIVVGLMAQTREWKRAFSLAAMALVGTSGVLAHTMVQMSLPLRLEMASLLAGITLLVLGHLALAREGNDRDGMATVGLMLGSLATVIPLSLGLLWSRLAETGVLAGWGLFHEVAAISAVVLLLGSGLLCRLRSTTISGAALLVVQIGSLVTLIRWPQQLQSISVLMMLGGGLFFGTAILLSIYRDRLLTLPNRIREGRGVFRVFHWR